MDATDFTPIVAAVSVIGVSAALVSMGAVRIVPNVASWASKKLSSFFR